MEAALDVIHRALRGDHGARAFLERTSSIYLLDVTDPATPKTYGCWNFIHQVMNEIERHESTYMGTAPNELASLVDHARLLTTLALRVARRSPTSDRKLVTTCLANSEQFFGTTDQAQRLIDGNQELRKVVIGRIAAMAFDFNFHRRDGQSRHSAFADTVVMDMFCAVLSANAISTSPNAVHQFASDWIIPSSQTLPASAVSSVVLHLALEGMRKTAPAGTKDELQQLSLTLISVVLMPILSDAVTENSTNLNQAISRHAASSDIATKGLHALKAWCEATDVNLPQIHHVCTKVDVSVIAPLYVQR